MAISVQVPKDLSGIKTKVALNLTKRQIICFSGAAVAGIPLYFLTKGLIGTSAASLLMMGAMLPFFFFAMYEKNGFPAEKILYFMLRQKILTPGIRPYRSENLYKQLEEKEKLRREFYEVYPKWNTVCSELSWSHYRLLMRIKEQEKREYYQNECVECGWSVRQLERQINSFYYERILATSEGKKAEVRGEIQSLEPNTEPKHLLKDPYILEFLGLEENKTYLEHELEQGLIDNLQNFLLELGKGFCFVARQKRITIDGDHYYIDLVFYNYILKCFVLIDLKTHKLTYQDIGQIDFYVKYFEENIKTEGDNPTIGIVLCSEKNETMVKYSVLNENDHLYASKYKLYMPTEEELKKEIERERFNIEQRLDDSDE